MSLRTRWFAAAVAACALVVPAVAESPLAIVPAKAPIVVHVRGWENVFGRLNVVLKNAAPDYAPLISGEIEKQIATALTGRELKGLAKEGPIFVVLTEVPIWDESFPDFAVAIRVTDYAQFRDGILKDEERKELKSMNGYEKTTMEGKGVFFLNKGNYTIVAFGEDALKLFQDAKAGSFAGKLDKNLEAKYLGADVSLYADVAAFRKKFVKNIAQARQMLEQALGQAEEFGMNLPTAVAKSFYKQAFQLIEDGEQFVVALNFPPEGLSLTLHAQVGAATATNALLSAFRSTPVADLGRLPAGAMMYSGGVIGRDWARGGGVLFLPGALPSGEDKDNKAASDAAKELAALKVDEWSSAASFPAGGLTAVRYQDPAKASALTLKLYQSIQKDGSLGGMPIKGTPEIQENAEKIGGFALHRAKFVFDFDRLFEKAPEEARGPIKQMMQKMMGTQQQSWFGTDGKLFIDVAAKGWNAAKAMLEDFAGGKGVVSAPGFVATRQRLPARAGMIGLIDGAHYAQTMYDSISVTMRQFGNEPPKMNPPEGPAQFLGYALTMEPRNVGIELWFPADGVKQVLKMLAPLLKGLDGQP
jgi:hypothetical protein